VSVTVVEVGVFVIGAAGVFVMEGLVMGVLVLVIVAAGAFVVAGFTIPVSDFCVLDCRVVV